VSRTARVAIVAFLGFNLSAYGAAPKHAHSSVELDAVAVVVNMETTESDSSAPEVQFVHARPDLDALRKESRFIALMERMRFQ
jgi:hypothetical protein